MIIKKIGLSLLIGFYFLAGLNHFRNPLPFLSIIPPYLPLPVTLNYLSGAFEILFALLLFPVKTRKYACWGIVLMLIAFIPVHIYMIQKSNHGPYLLGKNTITPFMAWLRLPIQGLFILWAYWYSTFKFKLIS